MKYVGSLKDYIFYNLTGEWVIDKSTASTSGMYNERTLSWDDEILAYAGISKEYMPPVVSTTYSHALSDVAAAFPSLSVLRTAFSSTSVSVPSTRDS